MDTDWYTCSNVSNMAGHVKRGQARTGPSGLSVSTAEIFHLVRIMVSQAHATLSLLKVMLYPHYLRAGRVC